MKGIITEIQRFSLKDGPGIRTTVFLKGCNMACAWCHNPETLKMTPQLMRYPSKCIGCGACLKVCKAGALSANAEGILYQAEQCTHCGACADVCYSGSLVMSGQAMSVEEVMAEILQDEAYYRNSAGGVTLSGGEVTVQPEFSLALLKALKEKGIHTAIETNMLAQWTVYEALLPYLDLVMLDIKLMDPERHQKWVGTSNQRVLENIRKLSETGVPFIIRTPVIPGVNNDESTIQAIGAFIHSLKNVQYYELLLFNPLGEGKYEALGMENAFVGARPEPDALAERLYQAAQAAGCEVCIG